LKFDTCILMISYICMQNILFAHKTVSEKLVDFSISN
jgi:hypothetical protein